MSEQSVPFLFDSLVDALYFGYFLRWKRRASAFEKMEVLFREWQVYRAKLTADVVLCLAKWRHMGLLYPVPPESALVHSSKRMADEEREADTAEKRGKMDQKK